MTTAYPSPAGISVAQLRETGVLQIREDPITDWSSFHAFAERGNSSRSWAGWCFRGQTEWDWPIRSSLELASENIDVKSLRSQTIRRIEQGVIRRFQREYHQYSSFQPNDDDYIEWMSIMRHHGAPVRLVDITYSIYVALFFAIRSCKRDHDSAIWLMNTKWITQAFDAIASPEFQRERQDDKLGKFTKTWRVLLNDSMRGAYLLNPFRMSLRLTRQRGGFLVPLDVECTFMENLCGLTFCEEPKPWMIKQKLRFNAFSLRTVFDRLVDMNSHSSSLFPDLDGFAESFKMLMALQFHTDSYTDTFE